METEVQAAKVAQVVKVARGAMAAGPRVTTTQDLVAMVARVETEEMVGAEVVAQVVLHSLSMSMAHPPILCVKETP